MKQNIDVETWNPGSISVVQKTNNYRTTQQLYRKNPHRDRRGPNRAVTENGRNRGHDTGAEPGEARTRTEKPCRAAPQTAGTHK